MKHRIASRLSRKTAGRRRNVALGGAMWRKASGGLSDAFSSHHKTLAPDLTLAHKALGGLGGSVFMLSPDFCLLKVEA